eukprot:760091-Hanusia_phi.AAC.5
MERLAFALLLLVNWTGSMGSQDEKFDVLKVVKNPTIHRYAAYASTVPTAEEVRIPILCEAASDLLFAKVYAYAMKVNPMDAALKAGVQQMSVFGHELTCERLREFDEQINGDSAEQFWSEYVLHMQKLLKRWGLWMANDQVYEELKRRNQTLSEVTSVRPPPGGYPLFDAEDIDDIFNGIEEGLQKDPNDLVLLRAAAMFTLWIKGLRPIDDPWSRKDRYASIPEYVDEAEKYFQRVLEMNPSEVKMICQYAKLQEAFRGNYFEAEVLYRKALEINSNHVPTLSFYSWFLRDIRNSSDWKLYHQRRNLLIDRTRLCDHNLVSAYRPAAHCSCSNGDAGEIFHARRQR